MLLKVFPFLNWFTDYSTGKFRIDFVAGLTVALVLIPQSMAYAQLAGLPPYYGLYAAFLPPMVAALFGSSLQLATGPVAVVSLMTAASLEPLAAAGSDAFIAYAVMLALTVGFFQLMLGVLKLGLIVNFLSHPVVNGFTNAAAIIIASSQLSKLFGVYVDKEPHHYETIFRVVEAALDYTHVPTLIIGVLAIGIMFGLKRLNPKIPYVLIAVVITTLISWGIGFEHNARVGVQQIDSKDVQESIAAFNKAINNISATGVQRASLTADLDKAEKDSSRMTEALRLRYELSVVGLNISQFKSDAHKLRTELRHRKFAGVKTPAGPMMFVAQTDVAAGSETDGRVWRIKVGNNPIDTGKVLMTGGGAVVGVIPKGLPTIGIPKINASIFLQLLPFAVIISLLGFMEAIAIAKAMAAKTGQRLDPNQELIGQGLANILGSFGKSYPISGSFSRSAVNLQAGALTGLSSVITSLIVVVTLLFFTPLLYHLPQAVLAAVIMMAVIGLINVSGFVHAWRAKWYDGAISVISFVATLALAPHLEEGIYIGVILSLGVFLYKCMRPNVASLSRDDDHALRDSEACQLEICEHVDLIRFDGPLFFANASHLEDEINDRIIKRKNLRHIIIAANGINDIDASGEEMLALVTQRLRSAGYGVSMSGVNETVLAVLKRTHLLEEIGPENIYPTMEKAISSVHVKTHSDTTEKTCPLLDTCRMTENMN